MDVEVQPSANIQGITGINGWRNRISVSVRAAARRGEANQATLYVLSKAFELNQNHLSITSGHRSKFKSVRIEGVSVKELTRVLRTLLGVKE